MMRKLDVERPINHRDIERRQTPQDRPATGTTGCIRSYELRLLWNPTAATLTISVRYNSSTETINLTRTSTASDIKTAIDAHTEFVAAEVECTVEGSGELWRGNKVVTLPSGATITAHTATMTRRDFSPPPEFYVNLCSCAGV